MWLMQPQHVTIDVETIQGTPDEAEDYVRRTFTADLRWTAATIGERYKQAVEAAKEKRALLDTAPIISVSLRTESDCRLIHWMPLDVPAIAGVPLERMPDLRSMLLRVRDYLDCCGPDTVIVGHNVTGFDLPKLRLAMIRNRIRLPAVLADPDQPVYDTMRMWTYFSVDKRQFVSLNEALELAGLPSHKGQLSGADVPSLYQAGQFETIALYAICDVLAEDSLYLWMTGRTTDGIPPATGEAEHPVTDPLTPACTEDHQPTVSGNGDRETAETVIEAKPPEVSDSEVQEVLKRLGLCD